MPNIKRTYIAAEAEALLEYANAAVIPFKKEFCAQRGYSAEKLAHFGKINKHMEAALKKMEYIQETKIVKGALAGKLNATFAIFTLKNVAGWRDADILDKAKSVLFKIVRTPESAKELHEPQINPNITDDDAGAGIHREGSNTNKKTDLRLRFTR